MSSSEANTSSTPNLKLDSQMEKLWYGEKRVRSGNFASPRSPRSRSQSESLPLANRGGKVRPTSSQPFPPRNTNATEDEAVSRKKGGGGEKNGGEDTPNEFHSAGSLHTGTSSATQSQVQSPPPEVIEEKEKGETEKEDVALNPDKIDSDKENQNVGDGEGQMDEDEPAKNDAVHCCRCICFRAPAAHVKAT